MVRWRGPSGRSPRPLGVLVDGEIVGAWRSRLKGSRLEVTVDPFARLSRTVRDAVTAEAEQVAVPGMRDR
ncbi:MAG TPA: crosslink repair DNA glycosylase YcaQ family protein [Actinomycetota bacterium]|nr:crosslink repair DNA glycosylase YcaQ family protein [Actinomycetota bacterium]